MNNDEDMVYQEDGHYYEGEEVYDDFEDGAEYIEVDGRLIVHNPSDSSVYIPPTVSSDRSYSSSVRSIESQILPTRAQGSSNFQSEVTLTDDASTSSKSERSAYENQYSRVNINDSKFSRPTPPYVGRGMDNGSSRKSVFDIRKQMQNTKKPKKKIMGPGQRKPCNCTKSQCLKLYCDCFANGEFCRDCNCKDCHNNINHQSERTKAIRQSLERNPNAFRPKIGIASSGTADIERLHQKGCHCKKSGCLKNYCECYEAKVPCTDRCKCKGCQNTENDRISKFKDRGAGSNSALMSLANAASSIGNSDSRASSVLADDNDDSFEIRRETKKETDPRKLPWYFMTDEVIEATTLCMLAQAEETLSSHSNDNVGLEEKTDLMEKLVLREFGRCLKQIIENSTDPT